MKKRIKLNESNCWHQLFISKSFMKYQGQKITDKLVLMKFLTKNVVFDEAMTFGQFWKYIMQNSEALCSIFPSYITQKSLDQFDAQMSKKSVKQKFQFIAIRRDIIASSRKDHSAWITHNVLFLAKKKGKKQLYAVDFTPLNELKQAKIKTVDTIIRYSVDNKNIIGVKDSGQIIAQGSYTLFQILECILSGISFWGNPKQRNEQKQELFKSLQVSKNSNAPGIPIDKVFKNIKALAKKKI